MKKLNKVLLMLVVLMTVSTSTVATAAITTSHAGHGGVDPGAIGNGYKEADIARMINNQIVAKSGAVDATDNSAISVNDNLAKIVNKVNLNSNGTSWNLSNHLNSASSAATGVEVFYYAGDPVGKAKAEQVSATIANVLGIPNRGAKTADLYVIRNTKGHSLLIEWGFISNSGDVQKLLTKMDTVTTEVVKLFNSAVNPVPPVTPPVNPVQPPTTGFARSYNENGTMYATERNWVKDTPTKDARLAEYQSTGQAIKYHKVVWSDGIVWLQLTGWDGKQRYVAYSDATQGNGFGRKYGYCQ
ncbi:hypothetical protein CKN82_11080 [Carnobacterium divergens]|uniref:N-acetylmuramoyl-L-alanine amidase n=1 Tax=Carnobacterium divergens TaxID=2748 RepID=UPI0010720783|nr:N-acetylmuramoyl-L-alanine amidase [Carnobacterium divergens]TFI66634.1 hypothetical protein CKN70_11235 [Carnobacterium divergens]TFI78928.1 hypothetical protein CKN68_11195 [Carnobacterium divergens]TFI86576.1 hypothetical protein CKN72_10960 [Carnobacterium divergens]TFI95287.1 hypothetical protein CKN67_11200 [Carnobacterium divergens]TFI96349.1 hypothetical protein CKN82_11080 [Carnobacterium divergens]